MNGLSTNFAKNTSIPIRLSTAVALPLLAMVVLAMLLATSQWQAAGKMGRLHSLSVRPGTS